MSLSLQLSFKMSTKSDTKEYAMDVSSKYNEIKIKVKHKKFSPKWAKVFKIIESVLVYTGKINIACDKRDKRAY